MAIIENSAKTPSAALSENVMIISGKIKKGMGLGKQIGFPTLNLAYEGNLRGVFAGKIYLNDQWFKAAIHLGPKPTFNDDLPICEIFILDFDESVTDNGGLREGAMIKVEVLDKIRDIKKFPTIEDLKKQIAKDVEFVKMNT